MPKLHPCCRPKMNDAYCVCGYFNKSNTALVTVLNSRREMSSTYGDGMTEIRNMPKEKANTKTAASTASLRKIDRQLRAVASHTRTSIPKNAPRLSKNVDAAKPTAIKILLAKTKPGNVECGMDSAAKAIRRLMMKMEMGATARARKNRPKNAFLTKSKLH